MSAVNICLHTDVRFRGGGEMSLISDQVKKLRDLEDDPEIDMYGIKELNNAFREATDTIETLMNKLADANIEHSDDSKEIYSKDIINETMNDAMIYASREAKITTNDLLDTYKLKGLIGVYNLGLENMYQYLSEIIKEIKDGG